MFHNFGGAMRTCLIGLVALFSYGNGTAQSFDTLPRNEAVIMFPFKQQYNNRLIEESNIDLLLYANNDYGSLFIEETVFSIREKIPVAIRAVERNAMIPTWSMRYYAELDRFVIVRNDEQGPLFQSTATFYDGNLQPTDTFFAFDPHAFHVLPEGLGFATLQNVPYRNSRVPRVELMDSSHRIYAFWDASYSYAGISDLPQQCTCDLVVNGFSTDIGSTDTVGFDDVYHPNSIASIMLNDSTLVVGLLARNACSEIEITFIKRAGRWVVASQRYIALATQVFMNETGEVWVSMPHDLHYLMYDSAGIVKSYWDNGTCRSGGATTGLKVYHSGFNDTMRLLSSSFYGDIPRGLAQGNGGYVLPDGLNRFADLRSTVKYWNFGSTPAFFYPADTALPKMGLANADGELVWGVSTGIDFNTSAYTMYPYTKDELSIDHLRPELNFTFSADSTTVRVWVDSTDARWKHIVWADGLNVDTRVKVFSRTITVNELYGAKALAYATNDTLGFWYATKRIARPGSTTGIQVGEAQAIKIYPNPSNGFGSITINAPSAINRMLLVDMSGKVLLERNGKGMVEVLQLNGLLPGNYLIKVVLETGYISYYKHIVQ